MIHSQYLFFSGHNIGSKLTERQKEKITNVIPEAYDGVIHLIRLHQQNLYQERFVTIQSEILLSCLNELNTNMIRMTEIPACRQLEKGKQ